ncbi:DUF3348 domain-containing protein [Massilia sp. PAMC28688]|uniref:DUF3348 domain-containing protein n=1 Tax=Massilia sp. PAMC28688 TaxID=2861283 RepID=UPI001C62DEB2|nr:DUF3348 domain-containing protein [Massilia sp. PAMC28688]QYF93338.1 DUF3348 domain-containing protein [Massilia sp. PAMC28688]
MTRILPPSSFHSSQLLRCLADLDLLPGTEPVSDFAQGLGQWLHFTDAIALSSVLDAGLGAIPSQGQAQLAETAARLATEFERIQSFMTASIIKSCSPGGAKSHIKWPLPIEGEVSYVPYRRFYEAHQRDMELSVEPLRVNLRAALARATPGLRKLAELDVVMDKFLRPREAQLLARVPMLLQKRFDALYAAHLDHLSVSGQPDSPAAWMQPDGWLASFCQNLQTLLLAEADLRLQPSAGLLDALLQKP